MDYSRSKNGFIQTIEISSVKSYDFVKYKQDPPGVGTLPNKRKSFNLKSTNRALGVGNL